MTWSGGGWLPQCRRHDHERAGGQSLMAEPHPEQQRREVVHLDAKEACQSSCQEAQSTAGNTSVKVIAAMTQPASCRSEQQNSGRVVPPLCSMVPSRWRWMPCCWRGAGGQSGDPP